VQRCLPITIASAGKAPLLEFSHAFGVDLFHFSEPKTFFKMLICSAAMTASGNSNRKGNSSNSNEAPDLCAE